MRSRSFLIANPAVVGVRLNPLKPLFLCGLLVLFASCHYYEEYRVLKSKADLQEEQAELLRAYRLCLAKYQDEPPKAKEVCGPYTQRLREVEIRRQ